ncbi:MAG: lytic transglycosylase domain-containing protein [Pseudomonadota bacterium]
MKTPRQICRLIENEARKNGLPPAYFARLLWAESKLNPDLATPDGDLGIAQFSQQLAEERQLEDPLDPRQAIPEAAEYLAFLRVKFGNLGLAAAAYDAGENAVEQWLVGEETLAPQTQDYVSAITGEAINEFRQRRRTIAAKPLEADVPFARACRNLAGEVTDQDMSNLLDSPWAIQIAGHFDRDIAAQKWEAIKQENQDLVSDHPVAIGRVKTSIGRNGMFAVRIGFDSRKSANTLCQSLRTRGTACIVTKN